MYDPVFFPAVIGIWKRDNLDLITIDRRGKRGDLRPNSERKGLTSSIGSAAEADLIANLQGEESW